MADITETYGLDVKHQKDYIVENGDLATISGLDNVKEALFRRLITSKGSIVHRPDYGIGLKEYQNATMSLSTQRSLAIKISDEFKNDDRVEEVTSVSIEAQDDLHPEHIIIKVTVKLIGYKEEEFIFTPFGEDIT